MREDHCSWLDELLYQSVFFPSSPMVLSRDFPINILGSMFE